MQVTNAIAWGHFQLRGGWKNILSTAVGYGALISLLIFSSLYLDPTSAPSIYAGWTFGVLGLQFGVLVLYGCWCVGSAVRKDIQSKMIESHRLMPVSATDAVVGYILGPSCQAIALGVVNVLIGLVTCRSAGPIALTMIAWLKANAVIGIFAVSLWSAVAFLPMVFAPGMAILAGAGFVAALGHEVVPPLVPGLSLLIGPAMQGTVFGVAAMGQISHELQLSMLAQVLVAVLCYVGAVRKYRREDVLAWGPLMGLAVLATYVLVSMTGIAMWERFKPLAWRSEPVPFGVQLAFAAIGAFIVALLPVAAVARQEAVWRRRRLLHDPAPHRRPLPVLLVVILASLIGAALLPLTCWARWRLMADLPAMPPGLGARALPDVVLPISREMHVRTVLIFFAFLTAMSYLLRLTNRMDIRSRWLPVLFVAMLWLLPLMAEGAGQWAMKGVEEVHLSAISGASPIVAVIYLWSQVRDYQGDLISTTQGIAVQLTIAAVLGLIYHATLRRPALGKTPEPAATAA